MNLNSFDSQMFFTTVRITIPSDDGISSSIGTGFLVNVNLSEDGEVATFLVSNKHVCYVPN